MKHISIFAGTALLLATGLLAAQDQRRVSDLRAVANQAGATVAPIICRQYRWRRIPRRADKPRRGSPSSVRDVSQRYKRTYQADSLHRR